MFRHLQPPLTPCTPSTISPTSEYTDATPGTKISKKGPGAELTRLFIRIRPLLNPADQADDEVKVLGPGLVQVNIHLRRCFRTQRCILDGCVELPECNRKQTWTAALADQESHHYFIILSQILKREASCRHVFDGRSQPAGNHAPSTKELCLQKPCTCSMNLTWHSSQIQMTLWLIGWPPWCRNCGQGAMSLSWPMVRALHKTAINGKRQPFCLPISSSAAEIAGCQANPWPCA